MSGAASGRPRLLYYVKNIQNIYKTCKNYIKTHAKYVKDFFLIKKHIFFDPAPHTGATQAAIPIVHEDSVAQWMRHMKGIYSSTQNPEGRLFDCQG